MLPAHQSARDGIPQQRRQRKTARLAASEQFWRQHTDAAKGKTIVALGHALAVFQHEIAARIVVRIRYQYQMRQPGYLSWQRCQRKIGPDIAVDHCKWRAAQ